MLHNRLTDQCLDHGDFLAVEVPLQGTTRKVRFVSAACEQGDWGCRQRELLSLLTNLEKHRYFLLAEAAALASLEASLVQHDTTNNTVPDEQISK